MASHSSGDGDQTDTSRLADRLAQAFPELDPIAPVRIIGCGFRSLAVETSRGVVFRIGLHAESLLGFDREFRLLPLLAGRLPLGIPQPRWRADRCDLFPFGVIGYPKLPGVSLGPDMLAHADIAAITRALGGFLHALHSVPVEATRSAGLPDASAWVDELAHQRDILAPALGGLFTGDERVTIERWWTTFLDERRVVSYRPTLCHADLWYEHVLVDEQTWSVTGILDFERARIADPALDIATQMHLGEPFAASVLAAYHLAGAPVDPTFGRRARRLWEQRHFDGLYEALTRGDQDEIASAVAKIRRGPVLSAP